MADNRPWLALYPAGVPANIDADQYCNLVEFYEECFVKYKNLNAYEFMGKTMTYNQLDKESRNFAAYLGSRGLEAGDKIAVMLPNCLQYPIASIGAMRAGLVVVNTNPLYTKREMEYQFNDSEVKAIIILDNFAKNLEEVIDKTKIKVVITTSLGDLLGDVKGWVVNFAIKYVKRMVPSYSIPNTVNIKGALLAGQKFTIKPFKNTSDTVIVHQYTGGTTGISKGAMLTNQNLVANMLQMRAVMNVCLSEKVEVALSPLPMYHIFAFTVNCLAMMSLGAKTVLVANARDIGSILKEFSKNEITLMSGLNTLFIAMMNHPDFKNSNFSKLKCVVAGGMAVQTSVAQRWEDLTGCRIVEGYGMTESSPVITVNPLNQNARLGYIGLPVPSTEVRIVDDYGEDVAIGQAGELIARGPQIMKGYYKRLDETAKTVKGGWLYTGDIGVMEQDGFFKIVDRKKDMILVSGFNVYPNEIEEVFSKHPKVLEVAAIGIIDEKSGEAIKLFIVKRDASLTKDELMDYAHENLTGYKCPKEIEFRKELPKTNVGKILRRELRESHGK